MGKFLFIVLAARGSAQVCDPDREWAKLLAARGGQELMSRTKSVAIQQTAGSLKSASLYVLPNFRWNWWEQGPPFGLITIAQFDLNKGLYLSVGDPRFQAPVARRPLLPHEAVFSEIAVLMLSADTLMPQPFRCVLSGDVTIIEARVGKTTYRYHTKESLTFLVEEFRPGQSSLLSHGLSRYRTRQGLSLPTRYIRREGGRGYRVSVRYEINPRYDPSFLNQEPSIYHGPNRWRTRRR